MKTFSESVKEELCSEQNDSICCDAAEFCGMLLFGGRINDSTVRFVTGNKDVFKKYINLGKALWNDIQIKNVGYGAARYCAVIDGHSTGELLGRFTLKDEMTGLIRYRISDDTVKNDCCRRAFIKGAFLAGGTVINPNKNYNLEFVTPYLGLSRDMQSLLLEAGFDFKNTVRKSKYVLYLKNSETISDFLAYTEAFRAQMTLLNIKIEKEIHNDFNRSVNIETANLEKTINASVKQVCAIEKLSKSIGLENLPDDLREVAVLRLKHKDISLSELGELLTPPMSKSGVNRRLKRLIDMAKPNN